MSNFEKPVISHRSGYFTRCIKTIWPCWLFYFAFTPTLCKPKIFCSYFDMINCNTTNRI